MRLSSKVYFLKKTFLTQLFSPYFKIHSFGLTPASPLQVISPLSPGMSHECSLTLATTGAVQRMEPLTNLQVMFYVKA